MSEQKFGFSFADTVLAEAAGVPLDTLHYDVESIIGAAEAIKPIAEILEVPAPRPHLAGFCYPPIVALGAKVTFPPGSEPTVHPVINSPEEIDDLKEPQDYLANEVIRQRLATLEQLLKRRPDAAVHIGHKIEGPVTTAMLLMGPDFLTLLYDDPARAHKLLDYSVRTGLAYAGAITEYFGSSMKPSRVNIPDDFAGMIPPAMFEEFVLPYWERLYSRLQATSRMLHSELLRKEHLPMLSKVNIDLFDPSADQYLTPQLVKEYCPCKFMIRIMSWHVHDKSSDELKRYYRDISSLGPETIAFALWKLEELPKIKALLEIAREMKERI